MAESTSSNKIPLSIQAVVGSAKASSLARVGLVGMSAFSALLHFTMSCVCLPGSSVQNTSGGICFHGIIQNFSNYLILLTN